MAQSFSDLSRRNQWLVVGVMCLAAVLMFYMYVWRGNTRRIDQLQGQIQQLQMEINETELITARLPELETEFGTLQERLGIMLNILPEERETDQLLRRVAAVAADSNLTIRNISFEELVPYEFYAESPIELDLSGTYHNLALFFDRISKFARIINVDEVTITSREGEDTPDSVQASCKAMTFIFLEEVPVTDEDAEAAG